MGDHLDLLEGDEAVGHHLVELGEDGAHLVVGVDRLDEDRQVLRQAEDPRGVQVLLGPEALDATQDRRAGQPPLPEALDDRLVEGLALPPIALAKATVSMVTVG